MARPRKYPDELRERAVRLVFESGRPIAHVARDLGIHKEALRHWVRQSEADTGRRRDLLTTDEREELKRLRKENAELRRANAILKDASGTSSGLPSVEHLLPPGQSLVREPPRNPGSFIVVGVDPHRDSHAIADLLPAGVVRLGR